MKDEREKRFKTSPHLITQLPLQSVSAPVFLLTNITCEGEIGTKKLMADGKEALSPSVCAQNLQQFLTNIKHRMAK